MSTWLFEDLHPEFWMKKYRVILVMIILSSLSAKGQNTIEEKDDRQYPLFYGELGFWTSPYRSWWNVGLDLELKNKLLLKGSFVSIVRKEEEPYTDQTNAKAIALEAGTVLPLRPGIKLQLSGGPALVGEKSYQYEIEPIPQNLDWISTLAYAYTGPHYEETIVKSWEVGLFLQTHAIMHVEATGIGLQFFAVIANKSWGGFTANLVIGKFK